jgi:cytidine deaminase
MKKIPADLQPLFDAASKARSRSHSPYSGKKVGAAILTEDGKTYTGCNVENASYGATVCAERVAIQKAVSEQGSFKIKAVFVVTEASPPWPPCGMCRQVIAEFGGPNVPVHAANLSGEFETRKFSELQPNAFTPSHLS